MTRKGASKGRHDWLERLHAQVKRLRPEWMSALAAYLEKETTDPAALMRISVRVAAGCAIATLLVSWDLWFQDGRLYSPAPLIPALTALPHGASLFLVLAVVGLSALLLARPTLPWIGFLLPALYMFQIAGDQLRAQFTLYMFLFNFAVAAWPRKRVRAEDIDALRYMICGIYFWAGFYKINYYFVAVMFPWFISAWFPAQDIARDLGFVVPFVESAVGLCLLFVRTRWIGQGTACVMLLVVTLSIGPFGHNQAQAVWPANIYMDSMALLLFMNNRRLIRPLRDMSGAACVALALFVALPVLGMANIPGHHPTFKLYCCEEYAEMKFAPGEDLSFLPRRLQQEVTQDGRLNSAAVTLALYQVGSSPLLPGAQPFVDGMRGLCPHLKHPRGAELYIGEERHFWSPETDEQVYDICRPGEAQLIKTCSDLFLPGGEIRSEGCSKPPSAPVAVPKK